MMLGGRENGLDLQILEPIPTPLHQKSGRGVGTEEEKEEENWSLSKLQNLLKLGTSRTCNNAALGAENVARNKMSLVSEFREETL